MHVSVNGMRLFFDVEGGRTQCPTLVLGGEDNPMHPIESQSDLAATLPPNLVQFDRFADCGHGGARRA